MGNAPPTCIREAEATRCGQHQPQCFDPSRAANLEVDASLKGLGAALVHDDCPVSFASKTLTATQSNYSKIERECLGVVYGFRCFHNCNYGKHFTVVTDHKPLEMIFRMHIKCFLVENFSILFSYSQIIVLILFF